VCMVLIADATPPGHGESARDNVPALCLFSCQMHHPFDSNPKNIQLWLSWPTSMVSVHIESALQSWCIMQVPSQHELQLQFRTRRTYSCNSELVLVLAFAYAGC